MQTKTITKENYPYLLKQTTQLPLSLEVAGEIPGDEYKFLCVIGSRTHSEYGRNVCEKLIQGLAGYPIVIVSGLAIGIDSISHEMALRTGLKTIAFPGSGLSAEALYPSSRRNLAKRIVESGNSIVSPFKEHQIGTNWTFPTRNRLMAGISHATLVIEGRRGSGTLGTAKYAEDFNRDILAVPGDIFAELSYGPNMLIRRGATPVTCSADILEALGFTDTSRYDEVDIDKKSGAKSGVKKSANTVVEKQLTMNLESLALSTEEKMICEHLKIEKLSATDLIHKTALTSSMFNITISELEMKNVVRENGGLWALK